MPKNRLINGVHRLRDELNHDGHSTVRLLTDVENHMNKKDWLLVHVTYDPQKVQEHREKHQASSLAGFLAAEIRKHRAADSLPYAKQPGGSFQNIHEFEGGEILAVRSAFFDEDSYNFCPYIPDMDLVQSVEFIEEGEAVYAMVMKKLGHEVSVKALDLQQKVKSAPVSAI